MNNIAFIDGQNLHVSIKNSEIEWRIDFLRFRVYLKQKYKIKDAYYFFGYFQETLDKLYRHIEEAGFILIFKEHHSLMVIKKKGNVDSDIIFHSMKKLYKKENFNKIILVSGDGDYKMLVDFLIEENKFYKILFPSRKGTSSLFKNLKAHFFDVLEGPHVKKRLKNKNTPNRGVFL